MTAPYHHLAPPPPRPSRMLENGYSRLLTSRPEWQHLIHKHVHAHPHSHDDVLEDEEENEDEDEDKDEDEDADSDEDEDEDEEAYGGHYNVGLVFGNFSCELIDEHSPQLTLRGSHRRVDLGSRVPLPRHWQS